MRTTWLCLALLFIVPQLESAPAPDRDRLPKQKLEALKRRLPDLVGDWLKETGNISWIPRSYSCNPELRVLRRVSTDRAKLVILFEAFDSKGARAQSCDMLLTVFLSYQDGCWTTERSEAARRGENAALGQSFAFLMLAIDEAAGK
jgi:hypothetical protein